MVTSNLSFDRDKIIRALNIYHRPGDVVELRIPEAGRVRTISGYFNDVEALADSVLGLNGDHDADEASGIYITLNQIDGRLLSRAENRYKRYAKQTTADDNVTRLNWLPIDCDPDRPAGIPSSDEEHDAALSKVREIKNWLIGRGWPVAAFVVGDSGNGGHLPVKIDLEPSEDNVKLVKKCLEALDMVFSDEAVKVDLTTFNPARVWKLPGTVTRKGDTSEVRPHRLARLLEVPEVLEAVPRELLEDLVAILPKDEPAKGYQRSGNDFDPVRYAEDHGLKVSKVKPWCGGVLAELDVCPFNSDHKRTARVGRLPSGARYFGCFHNGCKGNDWQALRDLLEPDRDRRERPTTTTPPKMETSETTTTDEGGARVFHLSDFGYWETVRKRGPVDEKTGRSTFVSVETYSFSPEKATKAILERYDIVSTPDEAILVYEDGIFQPSGEFLIEKVLATTAGDYASIKQRREVLARVVLMSRVEYDELDSQPYLFPVENGIIDLRRGLDGFMSHSPKYKRTWKSPVTFDPSATCPVIEKYLASSLDEGGRNTYIDILAAKLSAYNFPTFSPWVGRGRNGKRMGTEVIRGIFGDSLITEVEIHKFHERRFDQIEVRGKHFIINNEVPRSATKGFDWIKKISGGDPITADVKGRQQVQFRPHALIIFDCNNPPKIDDYTKAIEERIAPIWWNVSFVDNPDPNDPREKQRDPHLEEKITDPAELSGFLNILLREVPRLIETRAIRRAGTGAELIEAYDLKANHLAIFWDRFMVYQVGAATSSTRAHERYTELCVAIHVSPISATTFNAYGQRRGFRKGRPYVTSDDGKSVRMNGWFDCLLDEEELELLLNPLSADGVTTGRQQGMDGTGNGTGIPEKNQHPGMDSTDISLFSPISEIERIKENNKYIKRSWKENPSHPFFPSLTVDSTHPISEESIPSGITPIPSVGREHVSISVPQAEGDRRQAEHAAKFTTPEPKDDVCDTNNEDYTNPSLLDDESPEPKDDGRIFKLTIAYWRDLARQHTGLNTRVLMDELGYDDLKAGIALNGLRGRGWMEDEDGRLHPGEVIA